MICLNNITRKFDITRKIPLQVVAQQVDPHDRMVNESPFVKMFEGKIIDGFAAR